MPTRRHVIASAPAALLAAWAGSAFAQEAEELQVNSTRYISTNADTGAIFAQRNAHDQVAIASLTKIFTAVEAVNLAPLDTVIATVSDDLQSADATTMGFGPGETFTLEELIYGMLLPSGNDAAHAIARALGAEDGDDTDTAVGRFMDLVNQRVLDMGLENTHLVNPDGWGVEGHYSSAADVAAFMAYACQNDFLLQVMGTKTFTTSNGYTVTNTNKVLTSAPSVIGGKTGYDDDAGWCLVQIAQRGDLRMIAVTLDGIAPDDWYNDNLVLLDYGFEQQTALGSNAFTGEFVTWMDPAPAIFLQSGAGDASIIGASASGEQVVTHIELPTVRIPQIEPQQASQATAPVVDGRRGSALLAGAGGIAMVAGMTVARWQDAGGEMSMAAVGAGLSPIGTSLRRAVPAFAVRRETADGETILPEDAVELTEMTADDPEQLLPDLETEEPETEGPSVASDDAPISFLPPEKT